MSMMGCGKLADLPDVLDVPAAAKLLGIGRNNCYKLVKEGKLRVVKIGKRFLVPNVAIAELLETAGDA
jgi:excisionase family DNA binding protein